MKWERERKKERETRKVTDAKLIISEKEPATIERTCPEAHRETIAWKVEKSLCLNLANCRNTRTNYHPTSQQSVPFLSLPDSFSPSSSLPLHPKIGPTSAFDLLQSRRSISPRESPCTDSTWLLWWNSI